ncbi:MAG: hypothetical protein ABH863_03595 [Candidatus Micrarchaeota archaeon]
MKGALFIGLLGIFLLFGCLQGQPPVVSPTPNPSTAPTVEVQTTPSTQATAGPTATGECTKPDLKFGEVVVPEKATTYGSSYDIGAEVMFEKGTCEGAPSSAAVGLYDGNRKITEFTIDALLAINPVTLKFSTDQTRDYNLELKVSAPYFEDESDVTNNKYPFKLVSEPFGFFEDVSGDSNFEITSTSTRAQAFELKDKLIVKEIYVLLKKSSSEYQTFDIFAEIRPDAAGKPSGSNQLSLSTGYSTIPMDFEWVEFSTPQKTTLQPGKYWLVLRTINMKPPVLVHMIPVATFGKPEFSMKSESSAPYLYDWKTHTEGVFNFKLSNNQPVPLVDYDQPSPTVRPSTDFDPYSAV